MERTWFFVGFGRTLPAVLTDPDNNEVSLESHVVWYTTQLEPNLRSPLLVGARAVRVLK